MAVKVQIQQTRQYAQAFGRNVYDDILRWGDSEILNILCRANKRKEDETYLECLRRFYNSMKLNYRCEYVFKNEIIAELRKHYAHRRSLVVNEFRVGNSIADLAFFNGESRAYEIKTSYDTPTCFDHYLRLLYRILKFVKTTSLVTTYEEEYEYTAMLRAVLSRYELVWLFYNGLTYGEDKLKPLIERYAMLSNLRTDMLANCSEIDEGAYDPSAYTKTIPEED